MSSFELLYDPKYCGKMKVLEKTNGNVPRGTQQSTSSFHDQHRFVYQSEYMKHLKLKASCSI